MGGTTHVGDRAAADVAGMDLRANGAKGAGVTRANFEQVTHAAEVGRERRRSLAGVAASDHVVAVARGVRGAARCEREADLEARPGRGQVGDLLRRVLVAAANREPVRADAAGHARSPAVPAAVSDLVLERACAHDRGNAVNRAEAQLADRVGADKAPGAVDIQRGGGAGAAGADAAAESAGIANARAVVTRTNFGERAVAQAARGLRVKRRVDTEGA